MLVVFGEHIVYPLYLGKHNASSFLCLSGGHQSVNFTLLPITDCWHGCFVATILNLLCSNMPHANQSAAEVTFFRCAHHSSATLSLVATFVHTMLNS